jgi:hypothetical protein
VGPADVLGYISHSTINIGDDFQSIAAKQFLPGPALPVDREFIAEFTHARPVRTVVSGWFMHQAGGYWELPVAPPAKSWPPSPAIDPLFISLHLTETFHATAFAPKNVDYLRAHAPIGARDRFTLEALREHGIPSYFSGCLTLTLPSAPAPRRDVIYLVDVDPRSAQYLRSRTSSRVVELTHGRPVLALLRPAHRLLYAEYVLGLYRSAKCVVTTRLHAALPCLASGTPVLMLSSDAKGWPNARFGGLVDHLRHGSTEELLSGELAYDVENPPPNPDTFLPLRADLCAKMRSWTGSGAAEERAARVGARDAAAPPHDGRFARAALVSGLIRPGDVGAEIGVLAGQFAYHVLLRAQPSKLYLIDPWRYGLQADVETDPSPENQAARDEQFERTRSLFALEANVEILRMKSQDAAAHISDRSLDYVYIDGEHSYDAVRADLAHYLPKVRPGGHLIGDDYGWSGVGAAVDAFVAEHAGELEVLVDPYTTQGAGQFVLRKLSAG